jgi:peptide-methionine (S)-S-oxide reductase
VENPTYYSLGDHTETIQIDYDPARISYEELLEVFWRSHNPARRAWSRQYMAAIFCHNEQQKELALRTRDRVAARIRGKVRTAVLPATRFYRAEDYHQKYRLRQVPELLRELAAMYPDPMDFVNSTAAARVNGYLGGCGTPGSLEPEVGGFGLSPAGRTRLMEIVRALSR